MGAFDRLPTLADMQRTRHATPKGAMVKRVQAADEARKDDERKLDAWRKAVAKRDKHLCRCCEVRVEHTMELTAKRAEVNHIKSRDHQATRYDVRNGVLLCHECHERVTGGVGTVGKIQIVGTAWFVLDGKRYINGSKDLTFKVVA